MAGAPSGGMAWLTKTLSGSHKKDARISANPQGALSPRRDPPPSPGSQQGSPMIPSPRPEMRRAFEGASPRKLSTNANVVAMLDLASTEVLRESVGAMWGRYTSALVIERQAEDALTKLLRSVLASYQPEWDRWHLDLETLDPFSSPVYLGRLLATPTAQVDECVHILRGVRRFLAEMPVAFDPERRGAVRVPEMGVHLFALLMLARTHDNTGLLTAQGVPVLALQLLRAAFFELRSLTEQRARYQAANVDRLVALAEWVLAVTLHLVAALAGALNAWCRHGSVSEEEQDNLEIEEAMYRDSKAALLQGGALRTLRDMLLFIAAPGRLAHHLLETHLTLLSLALNAVGNLLFLDPRAQQGVREVSLLDAVVGLLRWPSATSLGTHLNKEHAVQLLAVQVLREATAASGASNAKRVAQLGAYEGLMELLLWSAYFYTPTPDSLAFGNSGADALPGTLLAAAQSSTGIAALPTLTAAPESMPLPPPPPLPRQACPQLSSVLDAMLALCSSRRAASGRAADSMAGNSAYKFVVSTLLDIFKEEIRPSANNMRARRRLQCNVELQLQVLETLARLFQAVPAAVDIAHKYRMWDVLFSVYFYRMPLPNAAVMGRFKEQILSFVCFLATMRGHDPVTECSKLLQLLAEEYHRQDGVLEVGTALTRVLHYNLAEAQRALLRLDVFPILSVVIELQLSMARYYALSPPTGVDVVPLPYTKEVFMAARWALLHVLQSILAASDELQRAALRDQRLVDCLFALLLDNDFRRFALQQLLALIGYVVSNVRELPAESLNLFYSYFGLARRMQTSPLPSHQKVLLLMLNGITQVVDKHKSAAQSVLREVDVFALLMALANGETRPERLAPLTMEVLRTLHSLLAGHASNKDHFRSAVGYEALHALVARTVAATNSFDVHAVLRLLFGMLLEIDSDTFVEMLQGGGSAPAIQNPDVIPLLFRFLPSASKSAGQALLQMFTPLIEKNTLNQSFCCSQSLVFVLLRQVGELDNELATKVVALLEILGTFSITVRELKRLFALLKAENEFRSPLSPLLLKALQFMAFSRSEGPDMFFNFDGRTAGMMLPETLRWPNKGGMTFCVWLRVESYEDPDGKPNYQPRLWSFITESGQGIELMFASKSLVLQVLTPAERKGITFGDFVFREGKWYSLALTMSNAARLSFSQSEVRLFVDGVSRQRASIKYPAFTEPLKFSRIGTNAEMHTASHRVYRESPFLGQLGSIYFFDDALTPQAIAAVHALGPNYCGSFLHSELPIGDSPLQDGSLAAKMHVAYNCRAVDNRRCLDTSGAGADAWALGNLNACITRDVKDMMVTFGGIRALIPLFAQLDLPLGSRNTVGVADKSLVQLLALIGEMLSDSPANQVEMARSHGFAAIASLLEQLSPSHFTPETLIVIQDLQHKITLPALVHDVYLHVLLDFRIWINTPVDLQSELLQLLALEFRARRDYFRSVVRAATLLDIIRLFFYVVPGPDGDVCVPTRRLRPNDAELRKLRGAVLTLVSILCEEKSQLADAAALVGFLVTNTHDMVVCTEVLALVHSLLALGSNPGTLMEHVYTLGGVDIFLGVLRTPVPEAMRVLAIRSLGLLLGPASSSIRKKRPTTAAELAPLTGLLSTYPFTDVLYRALWNVLVQGGSGDLHTPSSDSQPRIVCPAILPTLLKLLLSADVIMRQHVLTELYVLLSSAEDNAEAFLNASYGWQSSLFLLLADKPEPRFAAEAAVVEQMLFNVLQTLLLHELKHGKKQGQRAVESTLLMLAERGTLDHAAVARKLFLRLLKALQLEIRSAAPREGVSFVHAYELLKEAGQKNSMIGPNLVGFFALLEDFMFCSRIPYTADLMAKSILFTGPIVPPSAVSMSAVNESTESPEDPTPVLRVSSSSSTLSSPLPSSLTGEHRGVVAEWEDLELAKETLLALDALKWLAPTAAQEHANAAKVARAGGPARLALRLCLALIREAGSDLRVVVECTPRIRVILGRDTASADKAKATKDEYASPQRLAYTLHHVLRALSACAASADETRRRELPKALVPLAKDLLRWCASALAAALKHRDKTFRAELIEGLAATTTIAKFVEAFQALPPLWVAILDHCDVVSRQLDAEEEHSAVAVLKLRRKALKNHKTSQERNDLADVTSERRTETEGSAVQSRLQMDETQRRAVMVRRREENYRRAGRLLRQTVRALTNERGPWGSRATTLHWKLDPAENALRMRLKLKRNYNFDPHEEATLPRGVATTRPSVQQQQADPQLAVLFKPLSGASESDRVRMEELLRPDEGATRTAGTTNEENAGETEERVIYTSFAELVRPRAVRQGHVELTNMHINFFEERKAPVPGQPAPIGVSSKRELKELSIPLDSIKEVHLRRYMLRRSALEFFLTNGTNFFFNFRKKERAAFYGRIIALRPANLTYWETGSPEEILRESPLTRLWLGRRMSNFEYLMQLNTIAGRTYNDLTQWPVFPWVIADYKSQTLDLANASTYRDLGKPVGALNATRLRQFIERYEAYDDPVIPKFHYGSHYSSCGIVLFYLIRMEPFTSLALQLQGGRFDHADRLFDSIPEVFDNCLTSTADVKELIPEFFYCPEFLSNHNNFNFGETQNGRRITDVILPPWAATAEDFVRINRAALESEYVSANLHKWIDLIFGYKQRGEEAVQAHNVFYYLTYEGAVDIDAIPEESDLRKATEAQIINFGQTPCQLLPKRAHPARPSPDPSLRLLFTHGLADPKLSSERVLTIDRTRMPNLHRWLRPQQGRSQFGFEADPQAAQRRRVGVPFASDILPGRQLFALFSDGKTLLSCGHWDNSFKVSNVENGKQLQHVISHKDVVTCIALAQDERTLVTGSRDTTVMVWTVGAKFSAPHRVEPEPVHILAGHNEEVTCVALNTDVDLVVSGSRDGSCIINSPSRGTYVRSMYHPKGLPISRIAISRLCSILAYTQEDNTLWLWNINGQLIRQAPFESPLLADMILLGREPETVLLAGSDRTVSVRLLHSLETLHRFYTTSPIRCLGLDPDERFMLAGLEDGKLAIGITGPSSSPVSAISSDHQGGEA